MAFIIRLIGLILYGGYFVLVAPLSLWLLFNAQTWVGRGLAASGGLTLLIPLFIVRHFQRRERQQIWRRTAVLLALLVVGFLAVVISAAPSGNPGPNSPVRHRFFRERGFGRFSLFNIIPESEQVNLGFLLMTYVDPIITAEQTHRVAPVAMNLYRQMEQDENFHELGSVMGLAYGQLFGLDFNAGHYYLYVPPSASSEPLPALVFLHGSAGNFKTYTWIWSKLAEQEGFVIIAPSYGFGNWDEAGVATVIEAIEDAEQVVAIDRERIYLAGLSNGGLGVSRTAAEYPDMFRGLIFLSPVFDTGIVDGDPFQADWAGRPILVISGEADRRIPIGYVEDRVAEMENGRIIVTTAYYPGEDHFLTFSQPDNIMAVIGNWVRENH
jgi:pimeloyl-ACP methyl ester carboxylesterase